MRPRWQSRWLSTRADQAVGRRAPGLASSGHVETRPTERPSLYEHAGGEAALHRLEQLFYDSVLRDPLLQPLFGRASRSTSST